MVLPATARRLVAFVMARVLGKGKNVMYHCPGCYTHTYSKRILPESTSIRTRTRTCSVGFIVIVRTHTERRGKMTMG